MLIKKDIKKKDKREDYAPTRNVFMTRVEDSHLEDSQNNKTIITREESFKLEAWILEVIDREIISNIKNNTNLPLAMLEEHISLEKWLSIVFKSILSKNDYKSIGKNIQKKILQPIESLKEESRTLQETLNSTLEEIDSLEEQKKISQRREMRLKREIESSIALSYLIDSLDNRYSKIKSYMEEDANGSVTQSYKFIFNFIAESRAIDRLKIFEIKDEEKRMEIYLQNTKEFFRAISSSHTPHRKEILSEFAHLISEHFSQLEFISPEDYLYFDNKIHAVPESSGEMIVEGINFAVVSKETKKTIIYADVIVK